MKNIVLSIVAIVLFILPLLYYPDEYQLLADDRELLNHSRKTNGSLLKAVLPETARISETIFGLPGLPNAGRVAPGFFRGAQPEPEGYKTLKAMGIKTVINLRSKHGEKQAVEAAGMQSIEIPINTIKGMDIATVNKVLSIMTDPDNQPVFVHCKHGEDRTGVIVAIYRMEVDGWSLSDAEAEMQAFGFNDIWVHLKKFLLEYPEMKRAIKK